MASASRPEAVEADADTSPEHVAMLRTMATTQACSGAWIAVLRQAVFTTIKPDKAEVARRKRLARHAALLYLQVLWKETGPVTEAELAKIGAERAFDAAEGVTCHGMAIESAIDKKETDKLDKRIRSIMSAAKHYGLVEEKRLGAKRNALQATAKLHSLLRAHHEETAAVLARIPPENAND
ncbi:MAG TPA: hypothetical protein VF680_09350 [Allosphingosinicella sp.]|jgi:hypothetical protein